MKKFLPVLIVSGFMFLGLSLLIVFKQYHQNELNMEDQPAYPLQTTHADATDQTSRSSMPTNKEDGAIFVEEISADDEYLDIYSSIQGGSEYDRRTLADTLFKNGYRHNPDVDLPIVIQSNVNKRTGLPLRKFPGSKIYRKHETDEDAALAFEKNLQQRELTYEIIEPDEGMISVQDAVAVAKEACPVEFDAGQKPKVNLIRDFYLVFLWEHRRPYTDGTYHAAAITIDAYSGEVRAVQVREDLKKPTPAQ